MKDDTIVKSIENVRSVVNNSLLILRDLDSYLSDFNLVPVLGNTLGTESSKSINQTPEWSSSFIPQFMFRPYVNRKELEQKKVTKLIAVNIQFFHPNYDSLQPLLIGGVFTYPAPEKDPKSSLRYWWLKYAALEAHDYNEIKHGKMITSKPFTNDDTNVTFWVQPLISLETQEDLQGVVKMLIELK